MSNIYAKNFNIPLFVSFLLAGNDIMMTSFSLPQCIPSIFVSFSLTPSCCFTYVWLLTLLCDITEISSSWICFKLTNLIHNFFNFFKIPSWILRALWLHHLPRMMFGPSQRLHTLREKCPNTEFFLVRIFLHSDWIRKDTSYLSVFSPNAGKYGPEKTPYLDTFDTAQVKRKSRMSEGSLLKIRWNRKGVVTFIVEY